MVVDNMEDEHENDVCFIFFINILNNAVALVCVRLFCFQPCACTQSV
jgi:hypothetical protein